MNTTDYTTGDTITYESTEYTITKVIYGEEDPNTYMPRMRYNLVDENGNTKTRVRQHEIKLIKKAEILKVKSPEKNLDDNMEDQKISLKNFKGQTNFNAKVSIQEGKKPQILGVMTPGKKRYLFEWTDYQSKIKPFYDIDIFTEDEAQHQKLQVSLLEEWTQRLTQLYPDGNISVATSHGPKVKTGTKKKKKYTINGFAISFHFIVNGYETTIPQLRDFNETNKLYDFDGCDKSVYRDGGNMRLLYSYKPNDDRQKVPHNNVDNPEYHLIQSNSWSNTDFKAINLSPPVSPVPKPVEEVVEEIAEFDDEEIEIKPNLPTISEIKTQLMKINNMYDYEGWVNVGRCLNNIGRSYEDEDKMFAVKSLFNHWSALDEDGYDEEVLNTNWKYWTTHHNTNKKQLGFGSIVMWAKKRDMPVGAMTLHQVFMSGGDDLKSKKTKMLKEMNERLIFVKETGDYIILDKKPVLLEDGTNILKPCWYLKTPSKAKDHFNKEKFSYTYTDENDKTKEIKINPFNVWCEWIERREVRAIGFDPKQKNNPDIFNLWNGFNISKEVADGYDPKLAQPILDHIKELWCKGNEEHYNYVLNLFAHYIQKPHIKTGVLLALKSKQGGGKGIILEKLGQIIGDDHYCQNSNAKFLFGDFNGQLEGKILINLDEAFWGGDKALEGVVKNKITERRQTINKKNKENYVIDDYANYIITTNNDWFAGTSEDDRRHYCLELHNKISGRMNKKTKEYVKPVLDAPAEAFANILYNRDISDYCPRIFKKTDLLQEQVERNWNSVKVWFHQTLKDGGFTDKDHQEGFCPWNEVPEKVGASGYTSEYGACQKKNKKTGEERVMYYKDYLFDVYNQQSADGRKFSREAFYRELKKNCLGDLYVETRPNAKAGVRLTYVILPDIDKTRENWNEHQEYDYEWDNDDEWE